MMLREKFRSTKMTRGDIVASDLTKFTQIGDELAAIGEAVDETELVRIALNSFTKQQDMFIRVMAQEKIPNWERLWKRLYSGVVNWVLTCMSIEGRRGGESCPSMQGQI
jgi:hypothetical protein